MANNAPFTYYAACLDIDADKHEGAEDLFVSLFRHMNESKKSRTTPNQKMIVIVVTSL